MKNACVWILLTGVLLTTGCGIQKRDPAEKQTFLLDIQKPAEAEMQNTGLSITALTCRAASPYTGRSLVYRTGTVEYEQDVYNLFLTPPAAQITEAMRQWFTRTETQTDTPMVTLQPELDAFYADFQDRENPLAIAEMHVTIKDGDSIKKHSFRAQTPLTPQPAAPEVVQALSQSLTNILTELTDYLNKSDITE